MTRRLTCFAPSNERKKRRNRTSVRTVCEAFEQFLQESLLPRLPQGSVLVLDNARIHHGGQVAALVEQAGCSLLYLPPYSPDFSPIELAWGWVKQRVRAVGPRDDVTRQQAVNDAVNALPPEFASTWFRKCGYIKC